MKNKIALSTTAILFFFSISYAKAQAVTDTVKVKPKYEYAFLTFRQEKVNSSWTYNAILEIDYEDGRYEKLSEEKLKGDFPKLYESYDKLFKAFDYLGAMRYELVTSRGAWDTANGVQYIFKRDRK